MRAWREAHLRVSEARVCAAGQHSQPHVLRVSARDYIPWNSTITCTVRARMHGTVTRVPRVGGGGAPRWVHRCGRFFSKAAKPGYKAYSVIRFWSSCNKQTKTVKVANKIPAGAFCGFGGGLGQRRDRLVLAARGQPCAVGAERNRAHSLAVALQPL